MEAPVKPVIPEWFVSAKWRNTTPAVADHIGVCFESETSGLIQRHGFRLPVADARQLSASVSESLIARACLGPRAHHPDVVEKLEQIVQLARDASVDPGRALGVRCAILEMASYALARVKP